MFHYQVDRQKEMIDTQGMDDDAILSSLEYVINRELQDRDNLSKKYKFMDVNINTFCKRLVDIVNVSVEKFYKMGVPSGDK